MGFGKFLLGGVCAVGAVVAAPVVLPAAGLAIAAAPVTGLAGVSAGLAIAGTSATTAAAVAGAAGVAVGAAQEKKVVNAYKRGCSETAKEYELKFEKQEEYFQRKIDELKQDTQKKNELIDIYEEYIRELEREKSERESRGENTVDLESALQKRRNELANIKSA